MLQRLDAPVTAVTFLGGTSGQQCSDWLSRKGIPFLSVNTRVPTRSGFVVRATGVAETSFLGPDAPPDRDAWRQAAELAAHLQEEGKMGAIAICGSAPGWNSNDATPFRDAIDAAIESGVPLFVDTYGPPLSHLVTRKVELVKVNANEIRQLFKGHVFGEPSGTEPDTPWLLRRACELYPVKCWIVSDGPNPVWVCHGSNRQPVSFIPPLVKEVSATGSGDVMMAVIIYARQVKGMEWEEAVKLAMPMAAANAAHPGIAEFDYDGLLSFT
ncbi:hypothetical protein HDU93_003915 [Gonapodya sp. JEL0774]|nr:hypothetical protein HDU93_003915 [Gonapodya sp. JEL0774]